jgi:iron complex outermembrane receptor protein
MVLKAVLYAAASVSALSAGAGWAEVPAAPEQPESKTVQEVVVTAQRLGVAEKALSANVATIDEKQLQTAPAVTLGDLVSTLPGVRSSSFAPGASRPVIRGMRGPRVQVLVNGLGSIDASALSDDHQVAVDPAEAESIEVVRGPATLAYGGSALGGVVNVLDGRIPDSTAKGIADGRMNAQLSSVDDGWATSGQAKVGQGPWVVAAQGIRRKSDDYAIPGPQISQQLADELGVPRTGPHKVQNSFVDLSEWGVGGAYVTGVGYGGASVKHTDTTYGTVAEPDVTIGLKQTRVDLGGDASVDIGPFVQVKGGAGWADYQHTEFEGGEVGTTFKAHGEEGRLELIQRKRGGWTGSVGVQGLKQTISAIGEEALFPSTDINNEAIYTIQRLDHGQLGFEGGVRLEHSGLSNLVGDRDFTDVSASGGVFFRPATGAVLSLTFAHNERTPNEIELFANGPHPATGQFQIGDPEFDKETGNTLEGAVHYDSLRWHADAHLYYTRFDSFIDLRPTGAIEPDSGLPIFRYVQTPADFYGLEVDGSYKLWTDGDRALAFDVQGDALHGETDLGPPALMPAWSITGALAWTSKLWDARAELHHAGEQDRVPDFQLPTDGYTMVNVSGAVRPFPDRGIELFAELHNAFDVEAREAVSPLKDIAPLPGRNLRVGVNYKF